MRTARLGELLAADKCSKERSFINYFFVFFFSFKTKGNLTKHMKSKAHFKKCTDLGLNPMDGLDQLDMDDMDGDSLASGDGQTSTMPGDENSDSDDMMSDGEGGYSTGKCGVVPRLTLIAIY